MDPARFRATGPGSALRGPAASLLVLIHLGILGARPVHAEGDPFEDALGMDYARQLLPTPDAPRPAVGALPGFSGAFPFARSPLPGAGSDPSGRARSGAPDTSRIPAANRSPGQAPIPLACAQDAREPSDSVRPARLEVSATAWQRDLIRREARFSFAHRRSDAAFDFAWSALPGLELRFAADRDRQELSLGDTAANANADGADWGWRAAVSFPLTPLLIPSAVVGARSSDPEGDALEALAFRGAAPGGLSWSLAWGRRRRDYPVGLKLPEYAPLSLPFLLRQDFAEAGLSWVRGGWDLSWSGSRARARPPAIRPPGYSLDDSATVWRQEARAAYARDALAAALDFDLGAGRHVFRGLSRRDGTVYPFSWQQGKQMDYAVRADISARLRRGAAGAWLAAGESEYDAVRPDQAYGRWFWDRNGVIDSYQGSLLGLFSGETWLMNGAVYAGHAGIGVWWRSAWAGFAYRAAAGYQYLILQADSHLSRRRTEFLLGYTQEDQDRTYPTVEADLLPVSLGLTRSWGNLFVTAGGQAALPLRIRVERAGSGGAGTGGGGADYGGGAVAGIRLGYRLP